MGGGQGKVSYIKVELVRANKRMDNGASKGFSSSRQNTWTTQGKSTMTISTLIYYIPDK